MKISAPSVAIAILAASISSIDGVAAVSPDDHDRRDERVSSTRRGADPARLSIRRRASAGTRRRLIDSSAPAEQDIANAANAGAFRRRMINAPQAHFVNVPQVGILPARPPPPPPSPQLSPDVAADAKLVESFVEPLPAAVLIPGTSYTMQFMGVGRFTTREVPQLGRLNRIINSMGSVGLIITDGNGNNTTVYMEIQGRPITVEQALLEGVAGVTLGDDVFEFDFISSDPNGTQLPGGIHGIKMYGVRRDADHPLGSSIFIPHGGKFITFLPAAVA